MKSALLLLALAVLPCAGQVKITSGPDKISIQIGGKPFTDFWVSGPELMKPYLFPVRAASGTYVTRMWPLENVAEEENTQKDHRHQIGLWFAHDDVNKLDFWNNDASYKTPNRGKIVLQKVGELKSGRNQGSVAVTFEWRDLQGDPQLTESRVMTFYDDPKLRTVDLDITLTAIKGIVFGDSKDGVLGIRLRPILQEQAQRMDKFQPTGHIVNADGQETEKAAWGKPSNWCDYSGEINGEKVGIAIFDNPANPRHPVRWHVRGYGLFAANPFGLSAFTNDKSQNGAMTLEPGRSVRFRYRIVIHPGDGKTADVAGLWNKYAAAK
ncbi:MAG: PmoA family protein [Acidobacteriia bacterium]|nr:PmoA family protein [Terriglobia bacterium]